MQFQFKNIKNNNELENHNNKHITYEHNIFRKTGIFPKY